MGRGDQWQVGEVSKEVISADELRQLTARADQSYLYMVLIALLLCWFGYLVYRARGIRVFLSRLNIPVPSLSIQLILILGFLLRIPRLFDSLWYDEAFTARMSSLPLDKLPVAIMGDVHPPLWYLIEWVTVRVFGSSEVALRLPSLILGVLLIYLVYRLTVVLRQDNRVALTAALLTALLPVAVYYSNEARSYSLLACLAILMLIAILEDRPRWFAIAGALICWTHNLGIVYLGVLGIAALHYALTHWREIPYTFRNVGGGGALSIDMVKIEPRFDWYAALVISGIGAGAWLPFLYLQSQRVSDGFWIDRLSIGSVLRYLADETIGRRIPEPFVIPLYLLFFILLILVFVSARRWLKSRPGTVYLSLIVGVPLTLALVSLVWKPVYLTRALLPCGIGLVIVWAYALQCSPAQNLLRVISVGVVGVSLVCFYLPSSSRADLRGFLSYCSGASASYATSIPAAMFLGYYRPDVPLTVWSEANDLNQTLTPDAKAAFQFLSMDAPPASGDVCIVGIDTPMSSESERVLIHDLERRYSFREDRHTVNELFHVNVYRFQIGEPIQEVAHAQS